MIWILTHLRKKKKSGKIYINKEWGKTKRYGQEVGVKSRCDVHVWCHES